MAHNIRIVHFHHLDRRHAFQALGNIAKAREARQQIGLIGIAGEHHHRMPAEAREQHLQLAEGAILRFIDHDESVIERAPAHISDRRNLDRAFSEERAQALAAEPVGERIVERAQIRRELVFQITGQKAIITRAKKSIANFKIRRGMPIGCAVTLRGDRMYEFLDRLCNVVLPRVRDFRGLPSNAFDGRGNYTLGLKDQLVFPEIDYTRVDKIKGMNITLTTTAKNDEQGRELLKGLGVPLREKGAAQ